MTSHQINSQSSQAKIRAELRSFLRDKAEWPSYRDFQRAGLKSLRDNITRNGGARRWADEMGVRYVERRPGYAPVWTEARIRQDLATYLAGRTQWPSREQFERDGLTALRNAINRSGGSERWAAGLNIERPDRLAGSRRGWTHEAIETELRKLIGSGTAWPTCNEFDRAGLRSMLSAIYQHEGTDYWAGKLGVERREAGRRPREAYWSEERIQDGLERFCAGRSVWPTEREFIQAGQRAVYSAASRNGGIRWWAERLGLTRGRVAPGPAHTDVGKAATSSPQTRASRPPRSR